MPRFILPRENWFASCIFIGHVKCSVATEEANKVSCFVWILVYNLYVCWILQNIYLSYNWSVLFKIKYKCAILILNNTWIRLVIWTLSLMLTYEFMYTSTW